MELGLVGIVHSVLRVGSQTLPVLHSSMRQHCCQGRHELFAGLPRSMERRFRLRHLPV